MSRIVVLHVGVAKTGTTYLQTLLFQNRRALADAGILYPGDRPVDQYVAALDLRGLADEPRYAARRAAGRWESLTAQVRAHPGRALLSHETMARCSPEQIERALSSFGDSQVQVVVTARDLGRQVQAVWQEMVKNQSTLGYEDLLQAVFTRPNQPRGRYFWQAQRIDRVVARWAKAAGADQVTVVTVPRSGTDRSVLWHRFRESTGLPDLDYELDVPAANPSLGRAETELLRRVNMAVPADFDWRTYEREVKFGFAGKVLGELAGSSRIGVPDRWHPQVVERAEQIRAGLVASGCRVVGDLDELLPVVADLTGEPPEAVREQQMDLAGRLIFDSLLPSPAPLPRLLDRVRWRLGRAARALYRAIRRS
ncbi:MAG TPA: hypothetical protein VFI30_01645 [Nocardioidaceae bacterium]|nr:hypothetical protein [Nocardioidaceae bacterium]